MKERVQSGFQLRRFCMVVSIFFLLLLPCLSIAEPDREDLEVEPPPPSELRLPGVGGVDKTHAYVSTTVESLAQRIDGFFGEDRIYEETTGTYIQFRGSSIYSRGGEHEFDGKFRAKVDLPNLEEKVNLVIESSDEQDESEADRHITTGNEFNDEIDDNDLSAAVQFMLREGKRWSISLRPGLKVSDPIETFIRLRFRRHMPLGQKWLTRATTEVGYYSDDGWRNKWQVDFERDIGRANFFRSSSVLLWEEEVPGNQLLTQRFLLTHWIDHRSSIAFEVGTTAETRPNLRDLSYFSSIRYRRDIHRGWLFFEFKPQVVYSRVNDYQADPALVLTLEALLGSGYVDRR